MNNICYKCGQEMYDKRYYLDNIHLFKNEPKIKHKEHIIHNSLYGKLKPNDILCKECGTDFSQKIDTDFVNLFNFLTEQIKDYLISKDHGKNSSNTLKGVLFDKQTQKDKKVNIRNNIVSPVRPFYELSKDEKSLTIFANKNRAKQYKNIVLKQLTEKGIEINNLNIEVINDISHKGYLGIHFSKDVDKFNEKFKIGFCKIAVGFATYSGIKRDDLPNVLKIDKDNIGEIYSENNLFPFIPLSELNKLQELYRPEIERHYPSHTLIVFSQKFIGSNKKHLYCYIDLFSTFQYYVLLNDNYKGNDIYETYYQTITKEEEKPIIDIEKVRYKYWSIYIDDYHIDISKYKGNSHQEYIDFLNKEMKNYSLNPRLNLKIELKGILSRLLTKVQIEKLDNIDLLSFSLELKHYFLDEENFNIEFYKKNFTRKINNKFEVLSLPIECRANIIKENVRKEYGYLKFNQLTNFIDKIKNT